MQIIFDSEEEKEEMVAAIARRDICPSDLELKDNCSYCKDCWRTALESVEKKEG